MWFNVPPHVPSSVYVIPVFGLVIDHISGMMNSVYPQALDQWHYADYYQTLPKLDSDWLKETRVNIDRTIAVAGKVDQYECDFYFENEYIRPIPVFSRPGLIDHP